MPYKDPERKRQWERENREQRNAERRKQRFSGIYVKRAPDRISAQEAKNIWPVVAQIVGFALVIGIGLLAGWVGVKAPTSGAVGGPN